MQRVQVFSYLATVATGHEVGGGDYRESAVSVVAAAARSPPERQTYDPGFHSTQRDKISERFHLYRTNERENPPFCF